MNNSEIEKFYKDHIRNNMKKLKEGYDNLKKTGDFEELTFIHFIKKLEEFMTLYTLIKILDRDILDAFLYYIEEFLGDNK